LTEGLPCLTAAEELAGSKVLRICQDRATQDLRVDAHPALVLVMPVFGDPVVKARTRLEVGSEATADPRGNAPVAQQGAAQHGEVATGADDSVIRIARSVQ